MSNSDSENQQNLNKNEEEQFNEEEQLKEEEEDQWVDVKPIPCPQNENLPFYIHYSLNYQRKMGLFRYVLEHNEMSKRAFDLVDNLIHHSFSNPTLWTYYRILLQKFGYKLESQRYIIQQILRKTEKPYQVWNHYQWLTDNAPEAPDETRFMDAMLKSDERNFHAWDYFKWYARRWNKGEWLIKQTKKAISANPLNASAWATLIEAYSISNIPPVSELDYVLDIFNRRPLSQPIESVIRYFYDLDPSIGPKIRAVTDKILGRNPNSLRSLCLLAHIEHCEGNIPEYQTLCERISKVDTIRSKFWLMMKDDNPKFC